MITSSLLHSTPVNQTLNLTWLGLQSHGLNSLNLSFRVPTAILAMAGLSCAVHLYRQFRRMKNKFMTWVYSFFNSGKYLSPISDKYPDDPRLRQTNQAREPHSGPGVEGNNQRSYAVIYGASNKAGKSFAFYLLQKGFNLILIERDNDSIQQLEDQLRKLLPDQNSVIIKCVLNKFD